MIIRHLRVKNLKLLRDFELSFVDDQGKPRMWTVIIGENGTAKTSLLQAIAMAAAGLLEVNSLAKKVTGHLRDRRQNKPMEVTATFGFLDPPRGARRVFPGWRGRRPRDSEIRVTSRVTLDPGASSLRASSEYTERNEIKSPLDDVRSKNLAHWFVAGYGIARVLPDAGVVPDLQQPSIERMKPLFDSTVSLTSTAFANYFHRQEKGNLYSKALKAVLFHTKRLLPRISNLELRGRGGVKKAGDLVEGNRFWQIIGRDMLAVPATALSHGYQSTIAWIADLVGHIILEADSPVPPEEMQGLVLIDELDLYLHPTWQVALVSALRETFPQIQFVATTHSPLVLAGMRPEEIVHLLFANNGDVERARPGADARILTGTEIYREYFGLDDIFPDEAGKRLRDYRYLAANPYRTRKDDRELLRLRHVLKAAGIDPGFDPVPRSE